MNALEENQYTRRWKAIGNSIPRPKVILSISAHWYIGATAVTAMQAPRTIHDFGGFPRELFEFQYPAIGDVSLANRVKDLLEPVSVVLDESWGLDHGTWSVLCHLFPKADIPVVQLSIDETKSPDYHYELAKQLASLRDERVLIIGSGNIVHNLRTYAWRKQSVEPFDWAVEFETKAKQLMLDNNITPLIAYESLKLDALLSVPTPEHYLPLLYVLALRREDEQISFPVEGFEGGSISMLTVKIG